MGLAAAGMLLQATRADDAVSRHVPTADDAPLTAGSPFRDPTAPADLELLQKLRQILAERKPVAVDGRDFAGILKRSSFPRSAYGVALVVYEPGIRRFKSVGTRHSIAACLARTVNGAVQHPAFLNFHPKDAVRCRIQLDFITEPPQPVQNVAFLSLTSVGDRRFEAGVDGLMATLGEKRSYFLPGDAFVHSMMSLNPILRAIVSPFKNVGRNALQYYRFRTDSYISFNDRWIRLYRGYPVLGPLTRTALKRAAGAGLDYVVRHQKENGQFLYYYEARGDSYRDHEHPDRDPSKNPYYNELRHAGGAMLLLYDYKLSHNADLLPHVRKAIDWLLSTAVIYTTSEGKQGEYFYYNQKSKLGGSGIGLYLLSEYQQITGDKTYEPHAKRLADHLNAQVLPDGEFIYYNIYLNKPVTPEENRNYFSFYYPGEAIIGMAAYYKYVAKDPAEKAHIADKIGLAMRFLMIERPKRYAAHYTSLPSDSWLMMGINELWDAPELRNDIYREFVYQDADKMAKLMYKPEDALYPDYPGAFYYKYGDYPFADGARCEGLLAAYLLALKSGDEERAAKYGEALKLAAWATMHLCNTPESVYSVPNPGMTVGGIRFKHVRQWFRVDTIQHVAAFYFKFLPYIDG